MYVGGGGLIDALGTRRGFLVVMLWWSLACASHGLARGLAMLAGSRFMLGTSLIPLHTPACRRISHSSADRLL